MLDKDLATFFDVKPRRLREQIKRNILKFPEHFMFKLTEEECRVMISNKAIESTQQLGGSMPYVFTEHGVLQLASILKSDVANQMSIRIIEVFVKMREMLLSHKELLLELEQLKMKVNGQEDRLDLIYDYLIQFVEDKKASERKIGYKPRKS